MTGGRDGRARLRRLLPEFRALSPGQTWIDHQPVTNCEALSSQGWDARSPYHSLDLLLAAGLRHFWTGEDVPAPPGSLNLLWPERAGSRRPLIYPFGLATDEGAWFFASSRFFLGREAFVAALGEAVLQRLEHEHGLFIGHVYLDTYKKPGERFSRRSLLRLGDGPGRYRLRTEVDEAFQRLAAHQRAGRLWVCGIDSLATFLRGRTEVELRPGQPGELLFISHAAAPLRGLTLRLPPGAGRVSVDGSPPAGESRADGGQRQIWFDLEPGARRRLRLQGQPTARPSVVLREVHHD